jgi:predicted nucleotide-binding protein
MPGGAVAADYVTKDDGPEALLRAVQSVLQQKVFIAHGKDEDTKNAVALLISNLGLRGIILYDQHNAGHAVIDQFENHTSVDFAVILLTPDDVGGSKDSPGNVRPRARMNVIFEFGYFIGTLGRQRVCALYKEGVELPSQYPEILYIAMDRSGLWKHQLARKMRHAGLNINLSRVV